MIRITNSTIKGYHVFKRRAHVDIPMNVEIELCNKHNINALVVKMPAKEEVREDFSNVVLRKRRGNKKEQKVSDNLNEIVGRVPATLCVVFKKLLLNKEVKVIKWCVFNKIFLIYTL